MRGRLSALLQISILLFVVFGCTVLLAGYIYAEKFVEETIKSQKYLIEENDVLAISVFEEPDLSVSLKVAGNGTIAYPLVGEIEVKGLTTYEIEKKLEKHLLDGEFLTNPRVSVKLDITLMKQYHEKEVFVIGFVVKSGPIPLLGKYITVLEAITIAGGFTRLAAPGRVSVIRVEDGIEKSIRVNMNKVQKGDKSLDIRLKAGDVVNVPEARF